jgi:hypothetical protein
MFFPTANRYISVPTSSAHAPSSTDIEPKNFGKALPQMKTPVGSGPNFGSSSDSTLRALKALGERLEGR